MYYEVHSENIAARGHAPLVAELLTRFGRHAGVDGLVPHESFAAEVLPAFGEDLMVLEPTADGDYLWTHYGREIARYAGVDRTGDKVSDMLPDMARFTADCLGRALAENRPIYTIRRSIDTVRVGLWERLILPTATREGHHRVIVFSSPMQFREDLLDVVLEASPSGIVVLRALRDTEGQVENAVIINVNRRAAELCAQPGLDLHDTDARRSLPFLADPAIWRRCRHAIELRRADTIETSLLREGGTTWLRIAVAPLGDGLLLTLTDITDLTIANQTLQLRAATLALEIGRERATRRALSEEIGQREERERELRRLAETDPLTALLNRRSFMEKANAAIAAAGAEAGAIALVIVDLDHFKQVNDSHGHAAGDAVIRAFADLLLGLFRSERNLVGRFGGEEFAILLQDCDLSSATTEARNIQEALAARSLPVSETLALKVTASLGVATRLPGEELSALMGRADQALYRAKNEGRNRMGIATPRAAAA